MSRRIERTYELVDVDASMGSVDGDADTTIAAPAEHPLTLPTGQIIDGKNTLQAFEGRPTSPLAAISPAPEDDRVHPTLPNGQIINAKNTLQTFPVGGTTNHPPIPREEEVKRSPDPPHPMAAPSPATVVAVAVDGGDHLIYAEVAPEPMQISTISLEPEGTDIAPVAAPWYKGRSTALAVLAIVALSLSIGLGLYFGLAAGDGINQRFPTKAPTKPFTMSPSPSPTMGNVATTNFNQTLRAMVLTSYINNITFSNETIVPNGTSPECLALAWLIANDTTLDTFAVIDPEYPISTNAIGFHIRQRYPLLVLWFQQTATEQWAITTGWLTDPNECSWYGITCAATMVDYNAFIQTDDFIDNVENAVVEISFTKLASSYVGVLPADVGLLTHLQHFEIRDTYVMNEGRAPFLRGSLPDSIGVWTALTYFGVSGNFGLKGTLPSSIGQWTALTYLDVSDNGLTGTLPNSMGRWTALTYFDVSNNLYFTGQFPLSVGNWTALTYCDVSRNVLIGAVPVDIGQWTALNYMAISFNYFTGVIPDIIGQWTALTRFDAASNQLTGTLAYNIGQWTSLTYFSVRENKVNGTLPDTIGEWTALTYFDVSSNALNGTIPMSIGNWSLIETADFSVNQFMGTMPYAICQSIDPDLDLLQVDCTVNCTCCNTYYCL
jgi:Leucine-rich repeat (LRR) protein